MQNNKPDLQITELFLIKADWGRCFMGSLKRGIDLNGNPFVCGNVIVNEGYLIGKASNSDELMRNLDKICLLKLDEGLHNPAGMVYKHPNVTIITQQNNNRINLWIGENQISLN